MGSHFLLPQDQDDGHNVGRNGKWMNTEIGIIYSGKYGKGIELWSKTVCTARGEGRTFRFVLTSGAFVRRFSFFKIRIAIDVIPFELI